MNSRTLILMAVLLLQGCPASKPASDGGDEPSKPILVQEATVRQANAPTMVEGFGSLNVPPDAQAVVASATGGRVLQVLAKPGEHVRQGQLLVVLQADPAVQADLEKARIASLQAKRESARALALASAGVAPRMQAQSAQSALSAAEADLAQKERVSGLATQNTHLLAPIAGVLLTQSARVGAVLAPQAEAATVSSVSTLWADISLGPDALSRVKVGMPAKLTLGNTQTAAGQVVSVNPLIAPDTQRGSVLIALNHAPAAAAPGAFARAAIQVGETPGLWVPRSAVVLQAGQPSVFVLLKDKAEMRHVTLGSSQGNDVVIISGVKPGEHVATVGAYELSDGSSVTTKGQP
jgi:RND family efflux transporter MFP subunit